MPASDPRRNPVANALARRKGFDSACYSEHYTEADVALQAADAADPARQLLTAAHSMAHRYLTSPHSYPAAEFEADLRSLRDGARAVLHLAAEVEAVVDLDDEDELERA